ncbi:MAG: hypothetical protein V1811_01105 [Candidatus Micrarchaeota archaeon]
MEESVLRKIIVLVIVILGVLVYFALQPGPEYVPLSMQEAKNFIATDLQPLVEKGGDYRFIDVYQKDGSWEAEVLVAENPHSQCPTLTRRVYAVTPFSFRPESIISNCNYRKGLLVYREEALINSAQTSPAKEFISGANAYGCAFKIRDFEDSSALEYCKGLDINAFETFSKNLKPDSWVVMWTASGKTNFYEIN